MDLIDRHQIGDLLCFKSENRIMGRPICEPVYRNPSGTADEDNGRQPHQTRHRVVFARALAGVDERSLRSRHRIDRPRQSANPFP